MPLQKIKITPCVSMAETGTLMIGHFTKSGDVGSIDDTEFAANAVVRKHGRVGMLTIMGADTLSSKVPDDVKTKSATLLQALTPKLIGTATVILGTGIGATMLRTFLTGFMLFAKVKKPQKVFSNVDDALAWFESLEAGCTGGVTGAETLRYFGIDFAGKRAA